MIASLPPEWATFQFKLDTATPSVNEIRSMHYQAYRKLRHSYQTLVWAGLVGAGQRLPATPLQQVGLYVERGSAGFLDWDNAYGGLKPLLDCLVTQTARNPDGLGLIQDDSPRHMPEPPYLRQVVAPRNKGFTVVRIFDLTAPHIATRLAQQP